MTQNIEIEFKNLLTKKEYLQLKSHFDIKDEDLFKQENHYFDTSDFLLKKNKAALRIRKKQDFYELTLKQPHKDGLLETNKTLTPQESEDIFKTGAIKENQIINLLAQMDIPSHNIQYFGSLSTIRAEKKIGNGLLVLDHSFYLNEEDFELEYEVTNRQKGLTDFERILQKFQIPKRQTKNKVQRFYDKKYEQQS
ncbi:CYTH domain-containing protein [Niallia sp. NCCP-28]|uniref:CYTH domain-containing protein n=1 Tax=Niallia sp. NCCP-28 TaxID=2934712 RepID=UPI00208C43B2|nr:CYTH domain-containing protein [Niallia sp. NCCP-28]GKU81809.1 putative triphosphatase YjbK [Niallia sp. NCCP-28]